MIEPYASKEDEEEFVCLGENKDDALDGSSAEIE
jgi:hypothetical protein